MNDRIKLSLPKKDKNGKDIWVKDSDPSVIIESFNFSQIIPISIHVRKVDENHKLFIEFTEEDYIIVHIPLDYIESIKEICNSLNDELPEIFRTYHNEKGFCWFLNDIVDLSKYLKLLKETNINYKVLYDIHSAEELYHNKSVAEIASFYILSQKKVELLTQRVANPDLLVQGTAVEIKTIQPTRCLDITDRGILINSEEVKSLMARYQDQIEKGIKQISGVGIVFIYFWCNTTNFVLGNILSQNLINKFPDDSDNKIITVIQSPYNANSKFYFKITLDEYEKMIYEINKYLNTPLIAKELIIPLQPKGVGFNPHFKQSLNMNVIRIRKV
jgi:hypothetical protein